MTVKFEILVASKVTCRKAFLSSVGMDNRQ
jgi:hypothetical protein